MSYATSTDTNMRVGSRLISAFFDTAGAARKAVDDLVAAGIPRQHITQTDGNTAGEAVTARPVANEDKGFWESLKDLFLPDEDRYTYAEGLRRGGYLVSVRADEGNYNKVIDILDADGAVDMDRRETEWRSEGWTGYDRSRRSEDRGALSSATAAAATTGGLAFETARSDTAARAGTAPVTGSGSDYRTDTAARTAALGTGQRTSTTAAAGTARAADAARDLAAGKDEVIPVYEERLKVGKRDVSHGRVRLRSYVVETPVNEQVSLHDEHVTIERKPVDRPVAAGDTLFQDRVIEAEERAQEAVISKEARVKEEITLRKTAEDRVQTVSDTVRRTEVDIDDGRRTGTERTGGAAGFLATDASRIKEHMDVISSDGEKIGTVDHLDGPDRIKLAKNTSPDGQHHYVPFAWIDHVDTHVHLRKTLADIKADPTTHA